MDEVEQATSHYLNALGKSAESKNTKWSWSSSIKEVNKAHSQLEKIYNKHEDFYLDQAEKESFEEFKNKIEAAGGNPSIAYEVFNVTLNVSDHAVETESKKSDSASRSVTLEGDPKRNRSSSNSLRNLFSKSNFLFSSKQKDLTHQLAEFESEIENSSKAGHLSIKELTTSLNRLSEENLKKLAHNKLLDIRDIIDQLHVDDLRGQVLDHYTDLYKISHHSSLNTPEAQQDIANAFLEQPATLEHQGLKNSGVDCYLSSALQCLRSSIDTLPVEKREQIINSLRSQYKQSLSEKQSQSKLAAFGSPLAAFLEKKFDGKNPSAAAFLRQEIHGIMDGLSRSGGSVSEASTEIAGSIDPITGNSKQQCDTSEALIALMDYIALPRVLLEEKDTYIVTGQPRLIENQAGRQHGGELILPFSIEKSGSFQEVIHFNWSEDITGENGIIENGKRHDIHKEKSLSNAPDAITLSLKRFTAAKDTKGNFVARKLNTPISGSADDITFPTHGAQKQTTYTPTSIICHYGGESANSGHYFTYRKEGDQWFWANDAQVTRVDLNDPIYQDRNGKSISHREFLEQNAYVISYRKVD
jgi:ubiquitin C-terminal hydrolase